jgi:hypothetical protein
MASNPKNPTTFRGGSVKVMSEFFKCYPIDTVALEDVCFNHRDKKWGKNFSTIETGKHHINNWIRQRAYLQFYKGYDTKACRDNYNYKKSHIKSAEVFNSHCSDALAIASDVFVKGHVVQGKFVVVDDFYRPVRRKLHYTQPAKGGLRKKYSSGNFKGVRKGTICNVGQIGGGTGNNIYFYDWNNKRHRMILSKVSWLSHKFKTIGGERIWN